MKAEYTFGDLLEIIKKLRGEGGCPWDREQTHESIRGCFIEETYEALEAMDRGEMDKFADELGDVLLQIVFHARIAEEAGEFSMKDVTTHICRKMIERHPHVFGDIVVKDSGEVLDNWDEIKRTQRGQRTPREALDDVSHALPSLMRSVKIAHKAKKYGVLSETPEEAGRKAREILQEEEVDFGALLWHISVMAEAKGVDLEEKLQKNTDFFIQQM